MQTTIRKWGNSQGLCIPRKYLRELDWNENDKVEVLIKGESVVIQKTGGQAKKAAALEQLKSLRVKVNDFDPERERISYLEEKYGV